MPLNRQARNGGNWPAYVSAANPTTEDSIAAIDPLNFLTFENADYDQQIDFETNLGLGDLLFG